MTTLNAFFGNDNQEIKKKEERDTKETPHNSTNSNNNSDNNNNNISQSKEEQTPPQKKTIQKKNNNLIPWTKKYAPKQTQEITGQKDAKKKIQKYLQNFKTEKKKALILWGPSGVGKTSTVQAIAEENDFELVELNASNQRNKAIIEEQLGNALKQRSLFGKSKLVLIDDLDGVSGMKDRGGATTIAKLIPDSPFPIIITCQDAYSDKVKNVRKKSTLIEYKSLTTEEIKEHIKTILDKENIKHSNEDLNIIAEQARGDLRAAINDCQMLSIGKDTLDTTILDQLAKRLQNKDMKEAIKQILQKENAKETLTAFDNVEGDALREGFSWLEYNMPKEYTRKIDRAKAFGCLTKTDVFFKRIMRRQHWRFLVYINALLTAGITTAKQEPYQTHETYKQSSRGLLIWQANMKYAKRKSIAEKIALHTHNSQKNVIQNFEFYIKILLGNEEKLTNQLELDNEEITYLKKLEAA